MVHVLIVKNILQETKQEESARTHVKLIKELIKMVHVLIVNNILQETKQGESARTQHVKLIKDQNTSILYRIANRMRLYRSRG